MSFLIKHSSTPEGDDTMMARRDPNFREKTGPYFCERASRVRWMGCLRRWKCPITGRESGLGGRVLRCFLVRSSKLMERTRNKANRITEYSKVFSILGWQRRFGDWLRGCPWGFICFLVLLEINYWTFLCSDVTWELLSILFRTTSMDIFKDFLAKFNWRIDFKIASWIIDLSS